MNRIWVALLLTALVAGVFTGCLGDQDDDSRDATPTADAVLRDARQQWDDTETAHFALAVEGEAYLDSEQSIRLRSAEGEILRPDSVRASARISVMLLTLDMSMIAVGGEMYMTNFVSGRWERAPDDFSYDPSILFSDTSGIGPVITSLENPVVSGNERIGGNDTRLVSGTVDAATVRDITAGAIQGENIQVTMWIGVETNDIYRVTLSEPEGVRDEPATWTLELSEHNAPVTIEPPQV
jgi:hypothetical protein